MGATYPETFAMALIALVLLVCQARTQWRRPRYDLPRIRRRRRP